MAKKRFRFESLPIEDQRTLIAIIGGRDEVYDEFEKTGKIPQDILDQLSPSSLKTYQRIVASLPSREEAIKKRAESGVDESALSDEDLEARLQAFQELGKFPRRTSTESRDAIAQKILGEFNTNIEFKDDPNKDSIAIQAADALLAGEDAGYSLSNALGGRKDYGGKSKEAFNFILSKIKENVVPSIKSIAGETGDFRNEIKRIEDIVSARGIEKSKEGEVQKFLTETPQELAQSRGSYLANLEEEGKRYLTEKFTPQTLLELNKRGLLQSESEIASLLASETGRVQSDIEQRITSLENDDNLFLADAAFRLKTAKLESSEEDFRKQVAFERTKARIGQQRSFEDEERRRQDQFELNVLRREGSRKLRTGIEDIDLSSGRLRSDIRAGNISQIGSSAGQIIGTGIAYSGDGEKKQNVSTVNPAPEIKKLG